MELGIGEVYGRWTVLGAEPPLKNNSGKSMFRTLCRCECGAEAVVYTTNLTGGKSKSCGCYRNEVGGKSSITHGMSKTKIYGVWASMIQRCRNPNYPKYKDYGGRGITVCERWKSFENFYEDMGDPPEGLTLERSKNNEGYSKENCVWANALQQGNNRRSTVILCVDGLSKPLTEWAIDKGIPRHTLANRIRLGWTHDAAVKTPVRPY